MSRRRKPSSPAPPPIPPLAKSREDQPSSSQTAGPARPFELRFTPDAAKEIGSLDGSVRKQLQKVLEKKLAVDPEGYGLPLHGPLAGYWKHRFGNHRVIYRIYAAHRIVAICAVGVRKQGDVEDVYRQLESIEKSGRLAGQLAAVLQNLLPKK
jgi:mRNA interferase RelE/StbE